MSMRLTLRTMLAYMEDVLEPADAQELGKKIEESEFATNLMHRIRDVTRRLRLAAPKLDGKGIGLDPNTVAEYLDNLLPSERVADFEKVCLESDVHLAEVASCHQILALILGAPAEIDAAMRDRMYKVPQKLVAPPPLSAVKAPPVSIKAPPVDSADAKLERKRPEVPEYLREQAKSSSSRSTFAIAAVLFLLIGGGALVAMQMGFLPNLLPTKVAQVSNSLPPASPPIPAGAQAGTNVAESQTGPGAFQPQANSATNNPPGGAPDMTEVPGTVTGLTPAELASKTVAPSNSVTPAPPGVGLMPGAQQPPPAAPLGSQPQAPTFSNALPSTAIPGTPGVAPGAAIPTVAADGVNATAPAALPALGPPSAVPPSAVPPSVVPPVAIPPMAAPSFAATSPVATQPPATPPTGPSPAAEPLLASKPAKPDALPPVAVGIGRLISEHEVLLRFDPLSKLWKRLIPRGPISSGDRILSLPSYRSNLTLGPSLSLQMLGGASAVLLAPDAKDVPGVELIDGRLLVLPLGKPGAPLRLKVGKREFYIVFVDADATLALEVSRHRLDGTNPESEPATVVLDVYATAGEVRWSDSSSPQADTLKAPAHRLFADAPPVSEAPEFTAQDFPNWIKKPDERTPIEKRASEGIDETLQPDRPITLGLKELSTDKRVEISSLALQCLAEIDEFDSFVMSLTDSTQRLSWNTQVEALRKAIARSPQTATLVRDAFEHHRGPKGTEVYRMLWGYSIDQLQAGAAAQLVKYLDSEDLDFRVLSFWNLSRIAGATHYYRPEFTAVKRATPVRAWKQKLESGQLIPKSPDARP